MLYLITAHIGGCGGQLSGGFAWAEGLPGRPIGSVTAAVWKGEAEAETECQHLHEAPSWSLLCIVVLAQHCLNSKSENEQDQLWQEESDGKDEYKESECEKELEHGWFFSYILRGSDIVVLKISMWSYIQPFNIGKTSFNKKKEHWPRYSPLGKEPEEAVLKTLWLGGGS